MSKFARRCAALMLAVVLLCMAVPAAFAAEGDTLPAGATTMGGANTTLIPDEEENCLSWLFGSGDTITMPYLNVKGQGLRRNVTLDLEDCLVGITYTELGSIGSYVSASAAQQAWKAQAVAAHSYLEYHKQYGSSANALVYTPVDQIPSAAREAIRKAVEPVKAEILTYNGSVCDAVWSASAGYNTQTGVYGTCSGLDAWGTDVPYLQSVERKPLRGAVSQPAAPLHRQGLYLCGVQRQPHRGALYRCRHHPQEPGRLCAVQHLCVQRAQLPLHRAVRLVPLLL